MANAAVVPPSQIVIKRSAYKKLLEIGDIADIFKDDPQLMEKCHNAEVDAYAYLEQFGEKPIPMASMIYLQKCEENQNSLLILDFVEGRSFTFMVDSTIEQIRIIASHVANLQAYGITHGNPGKHIKNQAVRLLPIAQAV